MASPSFLCSACLRRARPSQLHIVKNPSRFFATFRPATSSSLTLDFLTPAIAAPRHATQNTLRRRSFTSSTRSLQELSSSASKPTATPPPAAQPSVSIPLRTNDDGKPLTVNITPRAAHRLTQISTKDANPNLALRISVESGGCHGFQYLMSLTTLEKSALEAIESASASAGAASSQQNLDKLNEEEEWKDDEEVEDTVFIGPQNAKVVIDMPSLELLNGSTVDYTMELIGSQFKIVGIPGASSSCGCGTSFDIKL